MTPFLFVFFPDLLISKSLSLSSSSSSKTDASYLTFLLHDLVLGENVDVSDGFGDLSPASANSTGFLASKRKSWCRENEQFE